MIIENPIKMIIENPIKMIIIDTSNINTGKKNGVVVILQQMFSEKGVTEPQFINC